MTSGGQVARLASTSEGPLDGGTGPDVVFSLEHLCISLSFRPSLHRNESKNTIAPASAGAKHRYHRDGPADPAHLAVAENTNRFWKSLMPIPTLPTITQIPIEELNPDLSLPKPKRAVVLMSESIAKVGLMQPLHVATVGGKRVVVAGQYRLLGLRQMMHLNSRRFVDLFPLAMIPCYDHGEVDDETLAIMRQIY